LSTGPNPLDVPDPNGRPWPIHFNVYELATQNEAKKNWTQEAIRKNRARGNLICGHAGSDQPYKKGTEYDPLTPLTRLDDVAGGVCLARVTAV
jgi:hypothetical protein